MWLKDAGALVRPKGITVNSQWPKGGLWHIVLNNAYLVIAIAEVDF
jgi:hypothetical protein